MNKVSERVHNVHDSNRRRKLFALVFAILAVGVMLYTANGMKLPASALSSASAGDDALSVQQILDATDEPVEGIVPTGEEPASGAAESTDDAAGGEGGEAVATSLADAESENADGASAGVVQADGQAVSATAEAGGATVSMDAPAGANLPADAELRVEEVDPESEEYESYRKKALEAIDADGRVVLARFFDISIVSGGEEVKPEEGVQVSIEVPDAPAADEGAEPSVVHFEGAAQKGADVVDATEQAGTTTFEAESFSVYGVVYTVDFHWNVDGGEFEFSLPGGGYVSLSDLVGTLGVAEDEAGTEEDEVSEFIAEVEKAEFSNPGLVWVGRVDEATTVGALKDANQLDVEYSAELTDEQIAQINAQEVEAGDWALISLKPFDTEESLTITMNNGDVWTIKVTDAQIATHVITANGERFRITVTYEDEAEIPEGSVLVAEEIPEDSSDYEKYLQETNDAWEANDRTGFISSARYFDVEIQSDGKKVEPKAPVQVEIVHDDGLTQFDDESLSIVHFAENGTEFIDDLHRNEDGTEVVYEQESFSVIGTISTVKESGWPTANGQYVLVLQDGDDYYALKQDGTLAKVRYFNNTVSFIGEGTITTDYIDDYLWYVVSSGNRGKISDEYTEYNATPSGQTFIDPYSAGILSGTSRQLQIRDGKIYCSGQLPGSTNYTQVTLSASDGQLSRVALTSGDASPVFFASASSFTANDNETDLFTQVEVESLVNKWKEQKTQGASYDKTAEVYDYENRIYQVDIAASSSDYEVSPSIALEFVVDASRSMFFPTSVTEVGTFTGTNASDVRDWINSNGDTNQVYFVIQNKNGSATQYAIFYDPNSEYTVTEGPWWNQHDVTYRGQWLWCDASVYNPPDDVSNGGTHSSMQSGLPLSEWTWGNMDDGKIYTTEITGTSDGTYGTRKTWISRIEYLKQCARVASQVIYAVDENAQIGLIGFNANVTDYGTYGKSEQETLLSKIDNISLAGGTNHQAGLQAAIDKFQNSENADKYAGRKHVVVLVTDGAPNQSGVNWTTIGNVANTLKGLRDDFGQPTELYTMGLSLSNVGTNQEGLFGVSSGTGYTYAAEDAAQIINAVTKIVDGIFVQANLIADVKDVIDPAFYPVDKATGLPLAENEWIDLHGNKVEATASTAAGQIKKDTSTGNWYVEWRDQSIDWPTTDSNGAIVEPGWHGTVFVKAKEDFLGGNGISTNAAGSQLDATKFIVRGDNTNQQHDLPDGSHTVGFETPYVNVDELDITKNDTEWTVYLGTDVDPLTELKALWDKVNVKEVVTTTDGDHRVSSDGSLTYAYRPDTADNRDEANGREEFPIADLGITLTDDDWQALIAGNTKQFDYDAYDHARVGTITVSLEQVVTSGETDLSESPHATTVVGNAVEKYTLIVKYAPKGANISNWHTGSYGSGASGTRAGNIEKRNTHIINVFAKGLQITKVDLNDQVLKGAKFALYRTARQGETDLMTIDGASYSKVADLDTSATGVATLDKVGQLEDGEQYYLVETQVPDGYYAIDPLSVTLNIADAYTPLPGTESQTSQPETGIYNWQQTAVLLLDTEGGVKRTNADNTQDLTHTAIALNSENDIAYYRITNNPGYELPHTGGPGTKLYTLVGCMLLVSAGVLLWRMRASEDAA